MDQEEQQQAEPDEDGWPDVHGEAPPVDDHQLTQRPGAVSADG